MANQLLEAALAYAKRGWPVFPTRADKKPYTTNGVIDATTDPARIKKWWDQWPKANVAMDVGGAGMMVVDLDPGHDLAELKANVGKLPDTKLIQKTPRGGTHLFFTLDKGEIVANSINKLAAKVDVRSFHGYVLLAPSRTDAGAYTWESEGKPSFRSDEMVRLANVAKEKSGDRDNWIIEPDLEENVADAIKWLKSDAKIAIEGQGGDAMTYATAAHMKSFGISEPMAFDLMWEHWWPRCTKTWVGADAADFLELKIRNGYSYNTSPPGNITRAYQTAKHRQLFQPIQVELPTGREITAGRFRFVDGEGMEHIRPPDWLVPDFLPAGAHAILYGAPGTFKTFIALDIALTIATGATFPWEGVWLPNQFGPVLFSLGEGRPEFAKRKRAWEQTHWEGQRVKNLILSDPVPLVSEDWKPFIEGALAMSPDGYKLVVLDTVGRSMQGLNENAQEHASKFTQMVEVLQGELGATVLALHHTGYGEDKRARGSSVFQADADTVVRLDREGKDYTISLTMTKQKDAPEWDKAKWLELRKVDLGGGVDSLAAVKADPKNVAKSKASRDTGEKSDKLTDEILDQAVFSVLNENKLREYSTRALARIIAARDDIDVSSKTLQNTHLIALREKKGTLSHKLFDAKKDRWRAR